MKAIIELIGLLVMIAISVYVKLLAVTKVWSYVLVPLGAPYIGLYQAFAISWLVGLITYDPLKKTPERSNEENAKMIVQSTFAYLLSWGLAYLLFAK